MASFEYSPVEKRLLQNTKCKRETQGLCSEIGGFLISSCIFALFELTFHGETEL